MRTLFSNYSDKTVELAVTLWDRFLGYKLYEAEYTDTLTYDPYKPCILTQSPVTNVVSVSARAHSWGIHVDYGQMLGSTKWITIDPEHIVKHTDKTGRTAIVLPYTVFGTPYDEVTVVYRAGLTDIPRDVQSALVTVCEMIERGELDEWRCAFPYHVNEVIDKYKRQGV